MHGSIGWSQDAGKIIIVIEKDMGKKEDTHQCFSGTVGIDILLWDDNLVHGCQLAIFVDFHLK